MFLHTSGCYLNDNCTAKPTLSIENAITFTKEFHFRKTFVNIIEININSR